MQATDESSKSRPHFAARSEHRAVSLDGRAREGESEGQVCCAADLGHSPSSQPSNSRAKDAARHCRQVVQIDHAGSGHPVVLGEWDFGVEPSDTGGDVGDGDSVPPGAMSVPGEHKDGVALAGWSFRPPDLSSLHRQPGCRRSN